MPSLDKCTCTANSGSFGPSQQLENTMSEAVVLKGKLNRNTLHIFCEHMSPAAREEHNANPIHGSRSKVSPASQATHRVFFLQGAPIHFGISLVVIVFSHGNQLGALKFNFL